MVLIKVVLSLSLSLPLSKDISPLHTIPLFTQYVCSEALELPLTSTTTTRDTHQRQEEQQIIIMNCKISLITVFAYLLVSCPEL